MSKRKDGTHTGNTLIAFRLNQEVIDALKHLNGESISEKAKALIIETLKEKGLLKTDCNT
jgi:transcriptional regulator CtsR